MTQRGKKPNCAKETTKNTDGNIWKHENPEMLKISDLVVGRRDKGETSSFHVQFQVTMPLRRRAGGGA